MAIHEGLSTQLWVLATAVAAPLVLGAGVVRALGLRFGAGRRVFVAHAYLAGQLVQAAITFAWLSAHKPVPGVLLPALAMTAGALLLVVARRRSPMAAGSPPDWRMGLIALACAAAIVDTGLCVNATPIVIGDEADIWTAKARALYTAPGFDLAFALRFHTSHPDYPMLNPLAQVLAFASCDRVLLAESRLPIQAFAVSLLLLLSAAVRARTSLPVAAAAICAFTGSLFLGIGAVAYADVMLAFAMLAAADAWLRWRETGDRAQWRLACVALAAAVATKNEGTMLGLAFAGAIALQAFARARGPATATATATPRRVTAALAWLAVPLAVWLLGTWFNRHFELVNDLLDPQLGGGKGLLARSLQNLGSCAPTVVGVYARVLVSADARWLVLLCLVAGALHARRRWREPVYAPVAFVATGLLGYVLVFIGTPRPLDWHLLTAADRTVLHLTPVATLALAALLGRGAGDGHPPSDEQVARLSAPAPTTSVR